MSTTSTMTALTARDHIPSDIADLSNCMHIFVLTRGEGTLFDASIILEEDIIEICIWLGHTHPEGVLWYSAIGSVMLFYTTDKLQVMAHAVVKAWMLCKEAIRVRTSSPSAIHVRAYMASVNREPSGTQSLPSNREEEPHLSASNPHSGGRTPQQLQTNLGDLADDELWQFMEVLYREVTLWELNAPPTNPPPTLGEILWEWGSWCGWLGCHLSERGRVGPPGATTSTSCPHTTKWRVGSQRTS